ncbi:MAG: hypothetical protein MPN21_05260, partial [Thermoanaerobaculia bacterium]|nr:hypothetical protein [Thermoanaerobaculia bacterium]
NHAQIQLSSRTKVVDVGQAGVIRAMTADGMTAEVTVAEVTVAEEGAFLSIATGRMSVKRLRSIKPPTCALMTVVVAEAAQTWWPNLRR